MVNVTLDAYGSNEIEIVVTGANNVVETYKIVIIRSVIENVVFNYQDFTFV